MKKLLLLVMAAMLAFAADAQQIGVTGGFNVSNWTKSDYTDPKTGFNIGLKAEYEVAEPFFIEGSFLVARQGLKFSYKDRWTDDMSITTWSIRVPINFGYKFHLNSTFDVAPKVGIYGAFAVGGSTESDYVNQLDGSKPYDGYNPYKDFEDFTLDGNNFKRPDFGFGFGANVYIAEHFEVSTGWEFGVCDTWENEAYKNTHNHNWYVNLAFLF